MRQPAKGSKPRKAQLASFPSPTAGLVRNRNLSIPTGQGLMPGASVLRNWFPTASSVIMRRGSARWASLPTDETVNSLWTYDIGAVTQMFSATDDGIWDVSTSGNWSGWYLSTEDDEPIGTEVLDEVIGEAGMYPPVYPATSSDWSVLQFSTAGGTFLVGVNGVDTGFIYDGTTYYPYVLGGAFRLGFDAEVTPFVAGEVVTGGTSGATATVWAVDGADLIITGITGTFVDNEALTGDGAGDATSDGVAVSAAPGIAGISSDRLSYVWAYKQRVYFVEAGTLNAWYLPVDQVGGTAVILPLGGVFNLGGSLQWGHVWSLNSGGDGGLSEQNIFVTTEGEVAAYQGLSPDDAASWSKVGVYRIGKPMGKKAFIRAGGDLVIATTVGFVSLSSAVERDVAALGAAAVSYPIEDLWGQAVQERGASGWNCKVWPEGQMVYVAPPTPINQQPVLLVANANTGAWCQFTGWNVKSMITFRGGMFYGTTLGHIIQANVTGADQGAPYSSYYLGLFDDLKTPGSRKIAKMARVVKRGAYDAPERVSAQFNYDENLPSPPDAPEIPASNAWDIGLWDEAVWDAERGTVITQRWQSVGGSGHVMAIGVQITSGSVDPLDIEIIRVDATVEIADIVS